MSDIKCNCPWNPNSHSESCPVYLADEITALRAQLEKAQTENERVRQANLDVIMHFEDMKAAKEKAEGRVTELEGGLNGIANCAFDYAETSQTASEAAHWMNGEAMHLLGTDNAKVRDLRLQADAVDAAVMSTPECADGIYRKTDELELYAQRLRQQAEDVERGGSDA